MSSDGIPYRRSSKVTLVVTQLADDGVLMRVAAAQAKRTGARLLLAHVVQPPLLVEKEKPRLAQILRIAFMDTAREKLEYAALQLQWQGVECEPQVMFGQAAEEILALSRSRSVDTVMVAVRPGRSTRRSLDRAFARELMAGLDVPVCVVGRRVALASDGDKMPGRVVLPVSLHTDRAAHLDFARDLAEENGSRLTLLHVLETAGLPYEQRIKARATARARLVALANDGEKLTWPAEIYIREGDTARAIVEEAVCPHRDFIVLGSSLSLNLPPKARALHDIVHQVIAEARCPVVTLRSPVKAEARHAVEMQEMQAGSIA